MCNFILKLLYSSINIQTAFSEYKVEKRKQRFANNLNHLIQLFSITWVK